MSYNSSVQSYFLYSLYFYFEGVLNVKSNTSITSDLIQLVDHILSKVQDYNLKVGTLKT